MQSTVRISRKRQVTIPSKIFDHLKLEEGGNLIFAVEDDKIIDKKATKKFEALTKK